MRSLRDLIDIKGELGISRSSTNAGLIGDDMNVRETIYGRRIN
jgi:hypothetical protein